MKQQTLAGLDEATGNIESSVGPAPGPRVQRPDRAQRTWEDACLDERLAADHPARLVWKVVETLDVSAFHDAIRARGEQPGRAAIEPRLLLALWLYATIDGVGSGREVDRLCQEHDAYRWLCGGVSVNYHTLNDFRVQHASKLDVLLTQLVAALVAQDVVKVDRLSQDSLKVRASAGASSFHRRATLERLLAETKKYVEELKQSGDDGGETMRRRAARQRAAREKQQRLEQALALIPELQRIKDDPRQGRKGQGREARASRTDPDARKMKMADGGTRPGYSMQIGTDVSSGALVGIEVSQSASDSNQSEPLRAQVERRTGRAVKEHLADQGYRDVESIDRAERAGVAMYVPLATGKNGRPVTASRWDTDGTRAWRARMQTPAAAKVYLQRWATSERVNADLAEHRGLRQFRVRGLNKVRCVGLWMALAFNIQLFASVLLNAASAA